MNYKQEPIRHQLIGVLPAGSDTFTDDEIETVVKSLLNIPAPTKGESYLDMTRRVASMYLTGASMADEARLAHTINQSGFDALSEADRRYLYKRTRPVLHALAQRFLVGIPSHRAGLDVLMLASSDPRLKEVRCADGRFRSRHVYAAHPYDQDFYISPARFHHYLLEEKRAEFVRLMTGLGARSLRLLHSEKHHQGGGAEAGVTGVDAVNVGAKAEAHRSTASRFSLALKVDEKPTRSAALPDRLVWYHHEPLWKELAQARLAHGVSSFNVTFSYSSDFGVDASIGAAAEGIGLKIGGNFEANQAIVHEYEVSFWPRG